MQALKLRSCAMFENIYRDRAGRSSNQRLMSWRSWPYICRQPDTDNTWYWYWGIEVLAGIGIGIGIENPNFPVLVLVLVLKIQVFQYWYWYWYWKSDCPSIGIGIDIENLILQVLALVLVLTNWTPNTKPHFTLVNLAQNRIKGVQCDIKWCKIASFPYIWLIFSQFGKVI